MFIHIRSSSCFLYVVLHLITSSTAYKDALKPYGYVRQTQTVAEGETVAFACSFSTALSKERKIFLNPITWHLYDGATRKETTIHDNELVGSESKRFPYKILDPMTISPSSVLLLHNVPSYLSGTVYVCKSNIHEGDLQTFQIFIKKPVLYLVNPSPSPISTKTAGNVTLQCVVSSNFPPTSVYWTRRKITDTPILGDTSSNKVIHWGSKYTIPIQNKLVINYKYFCHANNYILPEKTIAFDLSQARLSVGRPSEIRALYNGVSQAFAARNSKAIPQFGKSYTLTCQVSGSDIRIFWYRNFTKIEPYKDPNVFLYTSKTGDKSYFSDLIFKSFLLSDRNMYTCKAFSRYGSREFSFNIQKVRGMPRHLKELEINKTPLPTTAASVVEGSGHSSIVGGSGLKEVTSSGDRANRFDDEDIVRIPKSDFRDLGSGHTRPTRG